MPDEFLNITQLAGWLGIRERVIDRLVRARRIPYRRIGKALRFRRAHIEAWLTTLEGLDAVKHVPVRIPDPQTATLGILAGPEDPPETASTFTRGPRRQVSAPSGARRTETG